MSPISPWEDKLKDMIMARGNHVCLAFLPNFVDVIGKADARRIYQLLQIPGLTYDGVSEVVPMMFKSIADPKLVIRLEGPIYNIGLKELEIKVGCYTHGLCIFHQAKPVSEIDVMVGKYHIVDGDPATMYHQVSIKPKFGVRASEIDVGSAFITWNVRHAARPSAKTNFTRLVELHKPFDVLLTEVRMHKPSFIRLGKAMELQMDWALDESVGLTGGVALLWDKERVRASALVSGTADQETRLLACIKPPNPEGDSIGSDGSAEVGGSPEI